MAAVRPWILLCALALMAKGFVLWALLLIFGMSCALFLFPHARPKPSVRPKWEGWILPLVSSMAWVGIMMQFMVRPEMEAFRNSLEGLRKSLFDDGLIWERNFVVPVVVICVISSYQGFRGEDTLSDKEIFDYYNDKEVTKQD